MTMADAHGEGGGATPEDVDWSQSMRDLGRSVRRTRELLGLTQEQLGRIAGVSQGAVSRLEMGVGLATPFLVVVKVQRALQRLLARIDPDLLSEDARRLLAEDPQLARSPEAVPGDFPLFGDPGLEELVRTYQMLTPTRREQFLAVVRAAAIAFREGASNVPPTRDRA